MEPDYDPTAPKRKGFWQRNCLGCAAVAVFGALAFVRGELRKDDGVKDLRFTLDRGDFVYLSCYSSNTFIGFHSEIAFAGPSFGTSPRREDFILAHRLIVPLWLPLSCVVGWIAFREWRRKRG